MRCRTYSSSTSSERITTAPAREGVFIVCACTEPAGSDYGAVCVERGGQTLPNKMLNHTHDDNSDTPTYLQVKLKIRPPTLVRFVTKRPAPDYDT